MCTDYESMTNDKCNGMWKQNCRVAYGLVSMCLRILQFQGRIQDFPEEGAQKGRATYYSTKFSWNLHENEEIGPGAPKLYYVDPPLNFHLWTSSLRTFDLEMTLTLILQFDSKQYPKYFWCQFFTSGIYTSFSIKAHFKQMYWAVIKKAETFINENDHRH